MDSQDLLEFAQRQVASALVSRNSLAHMLGTVYGLQAQHPRGAAVREPAQAHAVCARLAPPAPGGTGRQEIDTARPLHRAVKGKASRQIAV